MAIFSPLDFFGELGEDVKQEPVLCTFIHANDAAIVYKLVAPSPTGPWIAGGACLSWYNNKECLSDIDIYFRNKKQFNSTLEYITKNIQVYNKISSNNAITLMLQSGKAFNLQLINKNFYHSAQEVIDDFDISVCQIAWDGEKLTVGKNFVNDVNKKILRFMKINPNSHKRMLKYMCYGYEPDGNTINKLISSPIIDWDLMGSDHYA